MSSLKEQLGNGGEHRKEIYQTLSDIIGKELTFYQQKQIKKLILDYVTAGQDDLIKRLIEANDNEHQLKMKVKMLIEGSHAVCQYCHGIKIKRKFQQL